MKKIRFLILALVGLLGGVVSASGKTVYIQPNAWANDNAIISLNVWVNGTGGNIWTTLTEVEDGILKATFDDSFNKMAIMRGPEANKWNNEGAWNQTADMDIEDGKLYKLYDYDGQMSGIYVGHGVVVEDYTEPAAAGYKVDFNTAIITSNHDFAVAKGWSHIVPNSDYDGYGPYYMSYTYYSSMGVGSSGCLMASRQYAGDYAGGEVVQDILVTPLVNGTVTLDVKAYGSASSSNPAYVEVYAINADGTLGSLLKTIKEDIAAYNGTGTADWATFTLSELTAEQKLGLRCQYVYIDNFTAASANIPAERKLEVTKVANLEGATGTAGTTTYFEQQADGKLKVQLQVTLTNTGDYDFAVGDEGYTLTLASATSASGTKTYYDDATVNISEALAAGESKTFDVDFFIPFSADWKYYFVRENVSGTTSSSYRYASATAYESKFVFREKGSTSTSSLTVASWGTITESTTKEYEVANLGTAPLTITSYTQPEGFTLGVNLTSLPEGVTVDMVNQTVTVAGGASVPFTVTQDASATGTYTGTLSIGYKNFGSEEATNYTLNFSATVIGANTWFADFNTITSSSTNYPEGSVAESGIRFGTTYVAAANYDGYLYSYTSSSYASANNKFITPKLHANAGDQLAFDVRRDDSSSSTYNLKVYISTDRKTWGDPVYSVTAADLTSTFQTKQISFDTEGDYYVAFAIYGVRVDNLIGLEKVDVAHDLYIKSVSWPDASIKNGSAQTKPSVDVIPLTNETADSYTVKYVCGETVLGEGTPVALTASANSSKTIAINWTPNVESTTTFEGTKVVFEFTDGTKFETETFDLTVTNEPIFHFVNTIPTSKYNEPTDRTAPITFGKTNTADTQNFYIYNWGSGELNVKSISLPAGFTTSVDFPLTVAAMDENNLATSAQQLDITFSTTEVGAFSGDMVITYVNAAGEDATFTLPISGTKLDPNKFYAPFTNSELAAGSVYGKNVSVYAGYISSTSASDNIFVTPKLVATAGEKIEFDASLYSTYWSEGKVVVYAAATRDEVLNAEEGTTRTQLFSVSGEDAENPMTTSYQTFEVNVPAGEWYLGFEISGRPYVTEIYGLTVADVAHDWKIASSNIPTEAMQNVASTATVNILNFGLQNEEAGSYEVTAYVDGEATSTGEAVAIPMNHKLNDAGTQLSVNIIYPQVGTFPVYLEVKAGDYSVQTEPVDVNFTGEVATAEGIQVGTQTSTGRDYGFVDWYNNDGSATRYTDILYPAAKISAAGIKAGDKIASISFKGSNSAKSFKAEVTSWVGTSTGDITYGSPNKDDMAQVVVYSGTVDFPANIESVITLPEPIVWDGESDIRVYTEAIGQGSGNWMSVQYAYDSELTMSYNGTTKAGPVAFFTLVEEPATLSGTITKNDGSGLEGATITLKAENGVQYAGTTAADGTYSVNVIQSNLEYDVTIAAEGYKSLVPHITFNGESKTQDLTLHTFYGIVGDAAMGLDWDNDTEMTQSEEDLNVFTLTKNVTIDAAGTYYYKLRADQEWNETVYGYELPAEGNNNYYFGEVGVYDLTFTANVLTHSLELNAVKVADAPVTITMSSLKYATLYYENVNLVVPEGLVAYAAVVGDKVDLQQFAAAGDVIPAGTPVVLGGEAGDYEFGITEETGMAPVTNDLIGSEEGGKDEEAGYKYYVLNRKNGVAGFYFQKGSAGAYADVKPHQAYLKVDASLAKAGGYGFDDVATGIDSIDAGMLTDNDKVYTLSGVRVNANRVAKGVYIVNGQKVVIK